MTPEEAYQEALRRIRKAEKTGAVELDLSGWKNTFTELATLNRVPPELARLTWLQSLNLSRCKRLSGELSPLAGLTSLQSLNLSESNVLSGDLSPLAGLTSLQSLNLTERYQLSGDLSPLAGLTSLQSLNLPKCWWLSDLSPLKGLISLQSLNLERCLGIRRFAPLESLLPTLKELRLFGCKLDDLPPEVCGEFPYQNVLNKVRAHYEEP